MFSEVVLAVEQAMVEEAMVEEAVVEQAVAEETVETVVKGMEAMDRYGVGPSQVLHPEAEGVRDGEMVTVVEGETVAWEIVDEGRAVNKEEEALYAPWKACSLRASLMMSRISGWTMVFLVEVTTRPLGQTGLR